MERERDRFPFRVHQQLNNMELFVPQPKFFEMTQINSTCSISEAGSKVAGSTFYNRVEYVITGSMSSGMRGFICVWGIICIDIERYTGALKPLPYSKHQAEVNAGKRERGYNGMIVKKGSRTLVLTGERVTFYPSEEGKQTQLF